MLVISLLAVFFYLACSLLLVIRLRKATLAQKQPDERLLGVGLVGMLLHGWLVYHGLWVDTGLNVGFFSIFSLVGWLVALLLVIVTFRQKVESLGIVVFPFSALSVLLQYINADQQHIVQFNAGIQSHILISILAYSLLSIAAVQAILLYVQESHLHNKQPGGFIRALPPLDTMEKLLFRIIALGFIVLSISLISGVIYLDDMFAQHMVHKTILSVVAWFIFAILLWGRWQFGWRGRTAIRWTISGFVFLMLAYFGSKFVIELVLHR